MPDTTAKTIVFFGLTHETHTITDDIVSFLDAGFINIALIGPPSSKLPLIADAVKNEASQNQSLLIPNILLLEVDIASAESIGIASHNVRAKLGAWDVFVNCLALTAKKLPKTTIRGADEDDWWEPFERNVRTLHSIARHFFTKKKAGSVFFNVRTVNIDNLTEDKDSAENASQLAAARVVVQLEAENTADGFRIVIEHIEEGETLTYRRLSVLVGQMSISADAVDKVVDDISLKQRKLDRQEVADE